MITCMTCITFYHIRKPLSLVKNKRRSIEYSVISYYNSVEQRPEFDKISPYWDKIMLKDFNLH